MHDPDQSLLDEIDAFVDRLLAAVDLAPVRRAEARADFVAHLRADVARRVAAGEPAAGALRHALDSFGDRAVVARHLQALDRADDHGVTPAGRTVVHLSRAAGLFFRESRFALRRLARSISFTGTAVLTLGLGLGATLAMLTLVHDVVLQPLPYPQAERLIWLDHSAPGVGARRGLAMAHGLGLHYGANARTLDGLAVYQEFDLNLSGAGEPVRVHATRATPALFDVLRARPHLGRLLAPGDASQTAVGPVVVSYDFWRDRLGSDPNAAGRAIDLNGFPATIAGVLPRDFAFPSEATDIWIPLLLPPDRFGGFTLSGIARMKADATLEDVRRELDTLIGQLPDVFPSGGTTVVRDARLAALPMPLHERVVGDVAPTLWVLLATVAFVCLAACGNVAGLWLVRAQAARGDAAIRSALGASRLHELAATLVEALAVATPGAIVGLVLAHLAIRALARLAPWSIPRLSEVSLDPVTGLVAFGVGGTLAMVMTLLIGRWSSTDAADILRGAGRQTPRLGLGVRRTLVVAQVSLSLVLLVGSGLMLRTFIALGSVDLGFRQDNLLVFQLGLPQARFPGRADAARAHLELRDRLAALPGVTNAGLTSCPPLVDGCRSGNPLQVQGRLLPPGAVPPVVRLQGVTGDYFGALGISLRAGRLIDRTDLTGSTGAVVASESLVRLYWPNGNPVGQRVHPSYQAASPSWYTIVGVVADVRAEGPAHEPEPTLYLPLVTPDGQFMQTHSLYYTLGTSVAPLSMAAAARAQVRQVWPDLPVAGITTIADLAGRKRAPVRFSLSLVLVSAAAAVVLCLVGIYGVVSFIAATRRGELAIRVALGAEARQIRRLLLSEGLLLGVAGIAIGLGAALALTRLATSLLFGVSQTDPLTYTLATSGLLAVLAAAVWIPAWRASREDPVRVLTR